MLVTGLTTPSVTVRVETMGIGTADLVRAAEVRAVDVGRVRRDAGVITLGAVVARSVFRLGSGKGLPLCPLQTAPLTSIRAPAGLRPSFRPSDSAGPRPLLLRRRRCAPSVRALLLDRG